MNTLAKFAYASTKCSHFQPFADLVAHAEPGSRILENGNGDHVSGAVAHNVGMSE